MNAPMQSVPDILGHPGASAKRRGPVRVGARDDQVHLDLLEQWRRDNEAHRFANTGPAVNGTSSRPYLSERVLFNSFSSLLRIALAAVAAYAALILLLRLAGKRSLSKLNAFDLVVTVALGSTLASFVLSKDVAFADGILGLAMLLGLQYALTRLSIASPLLKRAVRSRPRLLLSDGVIDRAALARERVTEGEPMAAIRKQGIGRVEDVAALVLETDGSFSVIRTSDKSPMTALNGVAGAHEQEGGKV